MRRLAGYPRGFYSVLVVVFFALAVTGALLLPHMLTMRLDWDVPMVISGSTRLADAALHCGAAFVIMMLVGALASVHMRAGWHRRENIISGVLLCLLFLLLTATAVGIYYFGDEALSQWSSVIHTVGGLLLVAAVVWHGVVGHLIHNRRYHRYRSRRRSLKQLLLPGRQAGSIGELGGDAMAMERQPRV